MGVEIERKFLLKNDSWRAAVTKRSLFRQGYVRTDSLVTFRVRIADEKGFLTIKAPRSEDMLSRLEFEYEIPVDDAAKMLKELCATPLIEKYRHYIPDGEHVWEIDEFLGENAGLTVAEIELKSEHEPFPHPDWLGQEVTGDPRYFNSALAKLPYSRWSGVKKS